MTIMNFDKTEINSVEYMTNILKNNWVDSDERNYNIINNTILEII